MTGNKIDELIDTLSSLTVLEATELVRKLEKRWGVSAIRSVSKLFTPLPPEPDPQIEFDVILDDCGVKKIEVIKAIRLIVPGAGLKEAKDMSETKDCIILRSVSRDVAIDAKDLLEKAGASVRIV